MLVESIQRENIQGHPDSPTLEDTDFVSFGEFVTVMWTLDAQRLEMQYQ